VYIDLLLFVVLQEELTAFQAEDTLAPADLITGGKKEEESKN